MANQNIGLLTHRYTIVYLTEVLMLKFVNTSVLICLYGFYIISLFQYNNLIKHTAMEDEIFDILEKDEVVELETENDLLTIYYKNFFSQTKEFHFNLNAMPIFGCKTKETAKNKINAFLNNGFKLSI